MLSPSTMDALPDGVAKLAKPFQLETFLEEIRQLLVNRSERRPC